MNSSAERYSAETKSHSFHAAVSLLPRRESMKSARRNAAVPSANAGTSSGRYRLRRSRNVCILSPFAAYRSAVYAFYDAAGAVKFQNPPYEEKPGRPKRAARLCQLGMSGSIFMSFGCTSRNNR